MIRGQRSEVGDQTPPRRGWGRWLLVGVVLGVAFGLIWDKAERLERQLALDVEWLEIEQARLRAELEVVRTIATHGAAEASAEALQGLIRQLQFAWPGRDPSLAPKETDVAHVRP